MALRNFRKSSMINYAREIPENVFRGLIRVFKKYDNYQEAQLLAEAMVFVCGPHRILEKTAAQQTVMALYKDIPFEERFSFGVIMNVPAEMGTDRMRRAKMAWENSMRLNENDIHSIPLSDVFITSLEKSKFSLLDAYRELEHLFEETDMLSSGGTYMTYILKMIYGFLSCALYEGMFVRELFEEIKDILNIKSLPSYNDQTAEEWNRGMERPMDFRVLYFAPTIMSVGWRRLEFQLSDMAWISLYFQRGKRINIETLRKTYSPEIPLAVLKQTIHSELWAFMSVTNHDESLLEYSKGDAYNFSSMSRDIAHYVENEDLKELSCVREEEAWFYTDYVSTYKKTFHLEDLEVGDFSGGFHLMFV